MSENREGVFHLPIGEGVGTLLPRCGHSETPAFLFVQSTKSPMHSGQMSRSFVGQGEQDADKKRADAQLAIPDGRRQQIFEIGAHPSVVDYSLDAIEGVFHLIPPSRATASDSLSGAIRVTTSPRR
jgi:hypothetical protein